MILQLVPVLSMFFLLTTAAGAALWAVDLERDEQARAQSQPSFQQGLDGQEDGGELDPEPSDAV